MDSNKKMLAYLLASIFLFISDRVLKYKALTMPALGSDNFLSFSFVKNYHIAFSLPLGGPILVVLIVIIICALSYFIYEFFREKRGLEMFLLLLVVLGASSNLLDRLEYGYVIDYFSIRYFTVFNLADAIIVLGVLFFLLVHRPSK